MYQVPETEKIVKQNSTLVITELTKNGRQIFKVISKKIWLGSHYFFGEWETIEGALNLMISTSSQVLCCGNGDEELSDKEWNKYNALIYHCNKLLEEMKESK